MKLTPQNALQLLQQARAAEVGILLRTDDPHLAKQRLYQARYKKEALGMGLEAVQVRISPLEGGDIVLVNRQIQRRSGSEAPLAEQEEFFNAEEI